MIVEASLLLGLANDIKIIGIILTACSFLFGVFKVINWIKAKFVNIDSNVKDLKDTINVSMTGLRDDVKEQTTVLVKELQEQRADFRAFIGPALFQMQQNALLNSQIVPVRAKKNIRKK